MLALLNDVDGWLTELCRASYTLTEAEKTFGRITAWKGWIAECDPRDRRFKSAQLELLSDDLSRPVGVRLQLGEPVSVDWSEVCAHFGEPSTELFDKDGWGQPTHWMFHPAQHPACRLFLTVSSRDGDSTTIVGITFRWFPPGAS